MNEYKYSILGSLVATYDAQLYDPTCELSHKQIKNRILIHFILYSFINESTSSKSTW